MRRAAAAGSGGWCRSECAIGQGSPDALELRARVVAADGTAGEETLGEIRVAEPEPPLALPGPAPAGLIAVCMATFDPDPRMLKAQLDSIRAQTDQALDLRDQR